jgi:hypothetical protein
MSSMPASSLAVDASGVAVFSRGAHGAVHLLVHRCLDHGRLDLAARVLAQYLDDLPAHDSETVHLHWHLLVLEVALGHPLRALARLRTQVVPAIAGGTARTDGPSALWHLALAGVRPEALPWVPAARVALTHLDEPDPFLAMHDALALAGARVTDALDAWLAHRAGPYATPLVRLGRGLRAHARGDHAGAARLFRRARPDLARLGGSRAQRSLFYRIVDAPSAAA